MRKFDELPDDLMLLGAEGEEAEAFTKCMIGIIYGANISDRVCYDAEMVIDTLMEMHDWDYETANEWFDFNILGSYVGEGTPVFMYLHNAKYLLKKEMEEDAERPGAVADRS